MSKPNLSAVFHMNWLEWRYVRADGSIVLRLKTAKSDFDKVYAMHAPIYQWPFLKHVREDELKLVYSDNLSDIYELSFMPSDRRYRYMFRLQKDNVNYYLDSDGIREIGGNLTEDDILPYVYAYAYTPRENPAWASGKIGYQIFPDRFCIADSEKPGIERWNSNKVDNKHFFGGDLKGIIEKIPYMKELGVDIVYLTPIFESKSTHRYNTTDYYKIGSLLGNEDDLRRLSDELHKNGMNIVLDGVFNHSGNDFFAFQDALKNGENSRYCDWFVFDKSMSCGYHTFADVREMPKLNHRNRECREYFCNVGKYWIEKCHIDGWRLDVLPEIYPEFLREFRRAVLEAKPDAIIVAECWDDSRQWITNGDMTDSTMHYVWSRAAWKYFAEDSISLEDFDSRLNKAFSAYPDYVLPLLWNFIDSHDTVRFTTKCKGDIDRFKLGVFFQLMSPGVPMIFYGDELGVFGGHDHLSRVPMPWDKLENNPFYAFYKKLIHIRKAEKALQLGNFKSLYANNDIYAFLRSCEQENIIVIINKGEKKSFELSADFMGENGELIDLYSEKRLEIGNGKIKIDLEKNQCMILKKA